MKKNVRIICLILSVIMSLSSIVTICANAADDEYVNSLINKGFPAVYARKLAVLHKSHPTWKFEPLKVTQLSGGQYTWDYVLYQETDVEDRRSLVANSNTYINWRHPSNQQFDSGWWRASVEAVAYYLDPRNFLTEDQIFQFYDLKWNNNIPLSAVESVVKGTFMENKKLDGAYSNVTYAKYFYDIGKELGANPVYLASRVRAEQGINGTSPLINGNVGDKLWYYYSNKMTGKDEAGHIINAPTSGFTEAELKSYNGYYNYFNIGSAGTGYFEIYLGGMKTAKKGTDVMADAWGGDVSWNTHWKSIYGGAYTATNKYIKDYQNTPYLQKFNVDPRSSRNFWGQYMQNITGAQGMATQSYNSFRDNGLLGLQIDFLIPVYEGMPEEPCPHPDTCTKMIGSCVDEYIFKNSTFSASGWTGFDYPIKRFGYSVDGKAAVWSGVSVKPFANSDDASAVRAAGGANAVRFEASFKSDLLTPGNHTVMIMAEVNNGHNSVVRAINRLMYIRVTASGVEPAVVTKSYIDKENDSPAGRDENYFKDNESVWYIRGWFGVNYEPIKIGYSIDGAPTVYDDSVTCRRDTGLDPHVNGGIGYRLLANVNTSALSVGKHTLRILVMLHDDSDIELNALTDLIITMNKTVEPVVITFTPGDMNDDGKVNNKDVVTLFRLVSRGVTEYNNVYDYNEDGKINSKDVVALFRAVNAA